MKPFHIASTASLLALAACGSEREVASGTITDPNTGETASYSVKADGKDGTIDIRTDNGTMQIRTGAATAIPGGFPPYPGAEPNAGLNFDMAGGAGERLGMVNFLTTDSPDQVIAFYRAAAARMGHGIGMEATMGNGRVMGIKGKGGATGFLLTVSPQAGTGKTAVVLKGGPG